jgi:hypothetical protein
MQEETKLKDLKDWLVATALLPREEQHAKAIMQSVVWEMDMDFVRTALLAQGKEEAEVLEMQRRSLAWQREFFRRELGLENVV